ncbi:hypothetical protein SISSUDRAFT_1056161 [Sistotremastrum suecicum HHB10207 ss-3]|uniref:Uncharacterized protein n=1 Tax=Sistotremastrum suecicum HHB10207 ss-3 TaxID=1314776 RepID=A0A165X786_9AGAM|nr:hypothetical protein SISSUDRAFT_1056161 [Sistotremastrum suecicum HHB10207 ss-3]
MAIRALEASYGHRTPSTGQQKCVGLGGMNAAAGGLWPVLYLIRPEGSELTPDHRDGRVRKWE